MDLLILDDFLVDLLRDSIIILMKVLKFLKVIDDLGVVDLFQFIVFIRLGNIELVIYSFVIFGLEG